MFRQRISAALALMVVLSLTSPAQADAPLTVRTPVQIDGPHGTVAAFEMGAAEGPQFPSLVGNNGDLRGWRNAQLGSPQDPDGDIGAGSTAHPGVLSLNYDIGREVRIYDGRKRLIARFGRDGISFYVKPRIRRR